MLPTLRPKALRASDLVAVASLSGGLEESEASLLERGVETIEQMGLAVRVSPLVDLDRRWWWAAAPPREVAEEFNGLLADPQVRAIFSLTGGRMALSYLDLIDLEAIRADPKPLLGFSDISVLHLALHARTGLVCLHSDLVTHGFGYWNERDETRRKQLADIYLRVLTGDSAPGVLPTSSRRDAQSAGSGAGHPLRAEPRAVRRCDSVLGRGLHDDSGGLERPTCPATRGRARPDRWHGRGCPVGGRAH